MLELGDQFFQIFVFLIPITLIALIFILISTSKKRNEQLNRIEEKIDKITK